MASKRSCSRHSRRSKPGRNAVSARKHGDTHGTLPTGYMVRLTVDFDFNEPVTDQTLVNAVFAAGPHFPAGTFRIVGIDRPRSASSRSTN